MAQFRGGSLQEMLKEGTKHLSGKEEAVYKNIDACAKLQAITRTSLGPNGMNKMIINHIGKLYVTSDAATIIKELEVMHPAAKMLVLASQMQEQEVGDGTNYVIVFGGELLKNALGLLKMGLHSSEIISGFEKASAKAIELLETLAVPREINLKDEKDLAYAVRTAVASKQYGFETTLSNWIAQACHMIMPENVRNFSVDNVRVAKIPGSGVSDTSVLKGFVLVRDAEGTVRHVTKAKIAVYQNAIEAVKTETKGTVLFTNADQMVNFSKGEEQQMETYIKAIADTGVKVIATGGNISEMAMHFIERYGLMAVKVLSKFDLRRLCKAVGATAMVGLGAPTPEEMGYCDSISVDEIGSTKITIFRQDAGDSGVATIIVRGATQNILDDIERAVDDGVNVIKSLTRDARFVPGAGAVDMELAHRLQIFSESFPGLEQYAIKKYAEAFEAVPRTLAENAGLNATDVIASLYAAHQGGNPAMGVGIEEGAANAMVDAKEAGIIDILQTKHWGIRFASDAACTVLSVDQIIMSKPAGGPKPPAQGGRDGDE